MSVLWASAALDSGAESRTARRPRRVRSVLMRQRIASLDCVSVSVFVAAPARAQPACGSSPGGPHPASQQHDDGCRNRDPARHDLPPFNGEGASIGDAARRYATPARSGSDPGPMLKVDARHRLIGPDRRPPRRSEPAPARRGHARRGAAADPRRRGHRQDARAHASDRVSRAHRDGARERDPRDHVHEQGGAGDARARRGAARPAHARDVGHDLPRRLRADAARRGRAARLHAPVHDLRLRPTRAASSSARSTSSGSTRSATRRARSTTRSPTRRTSCATARPTASSSGPTSSRPSPTRTASTSARCTA